MTSIIKFQPISGGMDDSPPCYLLQIDDFRFLLECGLYEKIDENYLTELKRYVNQIDAVLLSYPDNIHLGALPYLVGKCGLSCPIYSTIPVYKMGQMFMYDYYQSHHNEENFNIFSLDDVDAAFDKIIQLRYNQRVMMKGKSSGLCIIPMLAGHMIGGTIWKIQKSGEEDIIIYATDFNHKKERHLNGCDFQEQKLERPSLFITDAFKGAYQQTRRRPRDEKLITEVLETIKNNGNVLIAVDTAGRVLELVHILDQLWRDQSFGLQSHSLCLLNNVSYNVIEFAKSQIEWISEKLLNWFETMRENPFQFKHLKRCHSLNDINKLPNNKVILASMPNLDSGFAREIFLQWASVPENSIILTSHCYQGSLGRDLIDNGTNRTITIDVKKRVQLEGQELDSYVKNQQSQKQESSEDEDDLQLVNIVTGVHDLMVKPERKKRQQKYYLMYPYADKKIKYDEYGELFKIEDFIRCEPCKPSKKKKLVKNIKGEIPTKCVSYKQTIDLRAKIKFIDFEGRSDGLSVQQLLTQLQPRKVILVRGLPEFTKKITKFINTKLEADVFTPNNKEIIDVTSETHIYQIRLTDSLSSSFKLQKGKDVELAWLDASITQPINSTNLLNTNLLNLEPISKKEANPHHFVFINELKLSDLKLLLTKKGFECEFSGGYLWCCGKTISIKRTQSRKIELEGNLSENYFKIRKLLYSQYALL